MRMNGMRWALFLGLCSMLLIGALAPAARAVSCTLATVNGNYAVATAGQQAGAYQVAVFRMTSDGNGNLTGAGSESINGTISSNVTMTGTYTVSANCAFTSTITDSIGNTVNISGAISQAGAQILGVSTDAAVLQYTAYRQHLTSCTVANAAGNYTFQVQGLSSAFGPSLQTGQLSVDSTGKGVSSAVANFSGTVVTLTSKAIFSVNSDCSFTSIAKYSNGTTSTSFGVAGIYQNDVVSLYIGTIPGSVALGVAYTK